MNAILTMSEKQISKIANDNKVLFVLKEYPSNFNHKRDVLIVEREGTSLIYGSIKVRNVCWRRGFFRFLWRWSKYVAFVSGSAFDYVFDKKGFYIFECYSYHAFKCANVCEKKAVQ